MRKGLSQPSSSSVGSARPIERLFTYLFIHTERHLHGIPRASPDGSDGSTRSFYLYRTSNIIQFGHRNNLEISRSAPQLSRRLFSNANNIPTFSRPLVVRYRRPSAGKVITFSVTAYARIEQFQRHKVGRVNKEAWFVYSRRINNHPLRSIRICLRGEIFVASQLYRE